MGFDFILYMKPVKGKIQISLPLPKNTLKAECIESIFFLRIFLNERS